MALYRFFKKQVPEVPNPYSSLSSSISPAAIKDASTVVKQCANLSSAAAKPRGTYAKFTPVAPYRGLDREPCTVHDSRFIR